MTFIAGRDTADGVVKSTFCDRNSFSNSVRHFLGWLADDKSVLCWDVDWSRRIVAVCGTWNVLYGVSSSVLVFWAALIESSTPDLSFGVWSSVQSLCSNNIESLDFVGAEWVRVTANASTGAFKLSTLLTSAVFAFHDASETRVVIASLNFFVLSFDWILLNNEILGRSGSFLLFLFPPGSSKFNWRDVESRLAVFSALDSPFSDITARLLVLKIDSVLFMRFWLFSLSFFVLSNGDSMNESFKNALFWSLKEITIYVWKLGSVETSIGKTINTLGLHHRTTLAAIALIFASAINFWNSEKSTVLVL